MCSSEVALAFQVYIYIPKNKLFVGVFVRHCFRVSFSYRWRIVHVVSIVVAMSRRAVHFTSAQLRAITAEKLRCGLFLLAVLSILAMMHALSVDDQQRVLFHGRTKSVSLISHAVDATTAFAWEHRVERREVCARQRIGKHWRQALPLSPLEWCWCLWYVVKNGLPCLPGGSIRLALFAALSCARALQHSISFLSASLLAIMLLCGGVEPNPGPSAGRHCT